MAAALKRQPLLKISISGGSDDHGDMNYVTSQGVTKIEANDNALGKARTAVYCPTGSNPVEALAKMVTPLKPTISLLLFILI